MSESEEMEALVLKYHFGWSDEAINARFSNG